MIQERTPNSYKPAASGNNFLFRLLGVEAITAVTVGTNMRAAMHQVVDDVAKMGRKGYTLPGGGSNAISGCMVG